MGRGYEARALREESGEEGNEALRTIKTAVDGTAREVVSMAKDILRSAMGRARSEPESVANGSDAVWTGTSEAKSGRKKKSGFFEKLRCRPISAELRLDLKSPLDDAFPVGGKNSLKMSAKFDTLVNVAELVGKAVRAFLDEPAANLRTTRPAYATDSITGAGVKCGEAGGDKGGDKSRGPPKLPDESKQPGEDAPVWATSPGPSVAAKRENRAAAPGATGRPGPAYDTGGTDWDYGIGNLGGSPFDRGRPSSTGPLIKPSVFRMASFVEMPSSYDAPRTPAAVRTSYSALVKHLEGGAKERRARSAPPDSKREDEVKEEESVKTSFTSLLRHLLESRGEVGTAAASVSPGTEAGPWSEAAASTDPSLAGRPSEGRQAAPSTAVAPAPALGPRPR